MGRRRSHGGGMPNIEQKLQLAARITTLRAELAALEAEFAGSAPSKPRVVRPPMGRGRAAPSVSERVLNMIREAGAPGITRRDILTVLPQSEAVNSALKVHSRAGRIYSDGGFWKLDEAYAKGRTTAQMRAVEPPPDAVVP